MRQKNPWDTDLEDAPRSDIPATGKVAARAKRTRRYVTFATISLPVLLFVFITILGSLLLGSGSTSETDSSELSATEQAGRALAIQTVQSWLDSDPAPLPSGELVTWDAVESIPSVSATADSSMSASTADTDSSGWPVDVHTLTVVATSTGQMFHTQVALTNTSAGPVVSSTPSLIPYTPVSETNANSWADPIVPVGLDDEALSTSVQTWAEAYFSGDASKLRQAVGDTDTNHTYIPMPAASVDVTISATSALEELEDSSQSPDTIIANVAVAAIWPSTDESGESTTPTPISFDVLIIDANTASPRVVTWGGSGTGPTLEAYGNALSGVSVDSPAQDLTQSASPTSEATS